MSGITRFFDLPHHAQLYVVGYFNPKNDSEKPLREALFRCIPVVKWESEAARKFGLIPDHLRRQWSDFTPLYRHVPARVPASERLLALIPNSQNTRDLVQQAQQIIASSGEGDEVFLRPLEPYLIPYFEAQVTLRTLPTATYRKAQATLYRKQINTQLMWPFQALAFIEYMRKRVELSSLLLHAKLDFSLCKTIPTDVEGLAFYFRWMRFTGDPDHPITTTLENEHELASFEQTYCNHKNVYVRAAAILCLNLWVKKWIPPLVDFLGRLSYPKYRYLISNDHATSLQTLDLAELAPFFPWMVPYMTPKTTEERQVRKETYIISHLPPLTEKDVREWEERLPKFYAQLAKLRFIYSLIYSFNVEVRRIENKKVKNEIVHALTNEPLPHPSDLERAFNININTEFEQREVESLEALKSDDLMMIDGLKRPNEAKLLDSLIATASPKIQLTIDLRKASNPKTALASALAAALNVKEKKGGNANAAAAAAAAPSPNEEKADVKADMNGGAAAAAAPAKPAAVARVPNIPEQVYLFYHDRVIDQVQALRDAGGWKAADWKVRMHAFSIKVDCFVGTKYSLQVIWHNNKDGNPDLAYRLPGQIIIKGQAPIPVVFEYTRGADGVWYHRFARVLDSPRWHDTPLPNLPMERVKSTKKLNDDGARITFEPHSVLIELEEYAIRLFEVRGA